MRKCWARGQNRPCGGWARVRSIGGGRKLALRGDHRWAGTPAGTTTDPASLATARKRTDWSPWQVRCGPDGEDPMRVGIILSAVLGLHVGPLQSQTVTETFAAHLVSLDTPAGYHAMGK